MDSKIFKKKIIIIFFIFGVFLILPAFSFSASLYLQPSSKNLNVGDNLTITIYVESSDQSMNAASGRITWDNSILKYISHSKSGSIFNFWVREPEIEGNEFVFEGVVFNPGFKGKSGKILTINFKAIKPGEVKIDFISGMVLANDGMGTNILKAMYGGSYKVVQAQQREEIIVREESPITYLPPKPIITSPTHPDPNKWYNNSNPIFEWYLPSNVDLVKTAYGKNPDLIPYVEYSPPISRRKLENIPDGTYYFAVQFENEAGVSEISRFKFNIDTKPPTISEFSLIPDQNSLHIKVSAKDELSGLDLAEIYLNDSLYSKEKFVDGTLLKTITNLSGTQKIKIVIKDKANNETIKEEIISFQAIEKPIIIEKEVPFSNWFIFIFISFLLLIVLIILIILVLRIEKSEKQSREVHWKDFEERYKNKFKQFIREMKEEIKNLDENPTLNEEERNIYRRFKEIMEKAEKEFEEYLEEEKGYNKL